MRQFGPDLDKLAIDLRPLLNLNNLVGQAPFDNCPGLNLQLFDQNITIHMAINDSGPGSYLAGHLAGGINGQLVTIDISLNCSRQKHMLRRINLAFNPDICPDMS